MPKVSVILPAFNASNTVGRAIQSVLRQSFQDFELIVINDGSRDDTKWKIEQFHDSRVRCISQANLGLVAALRRGIDESNGQYIARIDADDEWEHSDKLRAQVEYLDTNPDCVLVGTNYTVVRSDGRTVNVAPPRDDLAIRRVMLLDATFAHPTVLFRKVTYHQVGGYRNTHGRYVEDFDLWFRLGRHGTFHILPVFGLRYFADDNGISRRHLKHQSINTFRLVIANAWDVRRYPSILYACRKYGWRTIYMLIHPNS